MERLTQRDRAASTRRASSCTSSSPSALRTRGQRCRRVTTRLRSDAGAPGRPRRREGRRGHLPEPDLRLRPRPRLRLLLRRRPLRRRVGRRAAPAQRPPEPPGRRHAVGVAHPGLRRAPGGGQGGGGGALRRRGARDPHRRGARPGAPRRPAGTRARDALLLEWSPEKQAITTTLVRILFPMTGILVVSAWALGILNSHRRFFVSYVAPVLWNLAHDRRRWSASAATSPSGGAPWWSRWPGAPWWAGCSSSPSRFPSCVPYLKGFRLSLGRGVRGVARGDPQLQAGGGGARRGEPDRLDRHHPGRAAGRGRAWPLLGYAQTFYMLPISLFGMSVAASELPELSRMRGEAERGARARVSAALRRVAFFVIPSRPGLPLPGRRRRGGPLPDRRLRDRGHPGHLGVLGGLLAGPRRPRPAPACCRRPSTPCGTPARPPASPTCGWPWPRSRGSLLMFPLDRLASAPGIWARRAWRWARPWAAGSSTCCSGGRSGDASGRTVPASPRHRAHRASAAVAVAAGVVAPARAAPGPSRRCSRWKRWCPSG